MSYYSADEIAAMARDTRNMEAAGVPLATELDALRTLATTGNLGITAASEDVDAMAKSTGAIAQNLDTTSGLNLGFKAGRVQVGQSTVAVSGGTVTLSPSTTNYVEVDSLGAVTANTSGWTQGQASLWTAVTSSTAIVTLTPRRQYLTVPADGATTGRMLSTAGRTKEAYRDLPTIATSAGSTTRRVRVPTTVAAASKVTGASVTFKDALAASDTNYVKIGLVNLGASGAGSQTIADITANANSTKATGGTALAAKTPRNLTLVTLSVGTERDVSPGDVLELTITAVGTLANTLTEGDWLTEISFSN